MPTLRSMALAAAMIIAAASASMAQDSIAKNAARAVDSSAFYRLDDVQSVHLKVAEDDLKRMQAALPERISVRASFRWKDVSLDNVAIRFKGNSSSHPQQQHKRSYLVKFNEYQEDQRFLGLRRVSFDNGVQFGSLFSEPIITEILRDQGVKTHRCNYARLYLNERYQGVYVNVERIDESFIERHFPDKKGLLFKVDEGGPGANLQFMGDDSKAYEQTFEPETKSAKSDNKPLVDFIRLVNDSRPEEFAAKLADKMELDDFLKTSAVMLFSGAFDQLTGWNTHNYYLYHDGQHDRWRYLPWDLDVGFSESAFGRIGVLDDWNAAWPIAGQLPNPLMERIVADPALLAKYRAHAKVILEKYFEPEKLCAVIDARYTLIKADLESDPFPPRRITNPEDRSYDDIVASMKQFVRRRYVTAKEQLANPDERPPMKQHAAPPPRVAEKVQRIMRAAEKMQRSGGDVSPIAKIMQQVGPLLQKGQLDAAEKLVDEALRVAGEEPEKQGK